MPERESVSASGPERTEPACQPGRPAPDAGQARGGARLALGRLVATPTFLAGACIVVVAVLAYGTAQTHLLFSGLPPPPACQSASCSNAGPGGGNGVPLKTSARPATGGEPQPAAGRRGRLAGPLATGARPATRPGSGGSQGRTAGPAPQPPSASGPGGPKVAVAYRTLRRLPGGFLAAITIWNRGRSSLAGWQLWVRYRQARIDHVWGARWFPASPLARTGLVAPPAGQRPLRPGTGARFTIRVTGPAGPPAGCVFDGYRCTFSR